jgi:hypothetical protein
MNAARQSAWIMGLVLLALPVVGSAQTRYEAEALGSPRNSGDICGYDSLNGVVGRAPDVTASNGEVLFTSGPNRNFKFIFKGTGVNLIGREDADGVGFNWVLNGGTPSEMLGSGTMVGPARIDQQSFVIAPNGSLPNRLHTLEIRHNGGVGTLRVDALDVFGDSPRVYVDDTDATYVTFSPGEWVPGEVGADSALEAIGGSTSWSIVENASVSIPFNGTGIAVLVLNRADGRTINWDIDGTLTGTINIAAQNPLFFGFWHRWPLLIANDLPPGNHTLTIRNSPTGFVTFIDAFVIDGRPGHTPPLLAELESFSATSAGVGHPVSLAWSTSSEIDNVGFHVNRVRLANGAVMPAGRVNQQLIPGAGTSSNGAEYSLVDPLPLMPGERRGYFLVDIDASGKATTHGPFEVSVGSTDPSSERDWELY